MAPERGPPRRQHSHSYSPEGRLPAAQTSSGTRTWGWPCSPGEGAAAPVPGSLLPSCPQRRLQSAQLEPRRAPSGPDPPRRDPPSAGLRAQLGAAPARLPPRGASSAPGRRTAPCARTPQAGVPGKRGTGTGRRGGGQGRRGELGVGGGHGGEGGTGRERGGIREGRHGAQLGSPRLPPAAPARLRRAHLVPRGWGAQSRRSGGSSQASSSMASGCRAPGGAGPGAGRSRALAKLLPRRPRRRTGGRRREGARRGAGARAEERKAEPPHLAPRPLRVRRLLPATRRPAAASTAPGAPRTGLGSGSAVPPLPG